MARMMCALVLCSLFASTFASATDFMDDFQSGTLSSWECNPCDDWSVTCANSEGTALLIQPFQPDLLSTLCIRELEWGDFQLDLDLRGLIPTDKKVRFRYSVENGDFYYINLRSDPANDVWLQRYAANGNNTTLATVSMPHQAGQWHHLTIRAEGSRIRVWVDSVLRIDVTDSTPLTQGTICLGGWTGAASKCSIQWDNVSVIDLVVPTGFSTWGQIKARW